MRRPWFVPIIVLALLAALVWLAAARVSAEDPGSTGRIVAAASVRATVVTVQAPSLAQTRTASGQPAIAGVLATAGVAAGRHVSAGQVLAALDDRGLALQVERAEASARLARARIGVAEANLATLDSNAAKLADARRTLDANVASLRTTRAQLAADLAAARQAAAGLPPVLPPGTPDPRLLIPKLTAALAQLDQGLAAADAARAKLDAGGAKLADARSQVRGMRTVLVLAADASDLGVSVAQARAALATLRAPCSGTVTWIAEPGTVLFAGGPVARIVPDGPPRLDTYLDTAQLARVRVGAAARVSSDSHPEASFPGRVTRIMPVYTYPPTSLPTSLVHMTRAYRVTVTLDETAAPLPPGTPADLTISTTDGS